MYRRLPIKDTSKNLLSGNQPDEQTQAAAEPVKKTLEDVLKEIDTPEKAQAVIDALADRQSEQPAPEVAERLEPVEEAPPEQQVEQVAQQVKTATNGQPDEVNQAATAIRETAAAAVTLEGPAYEAVTKAVQEVTDPALQGKPDKLERPRRYLRDALMRHPGISFLDKYDARLFIFINNNAPRTPATNAFFHYLSMIFNGGWAWIIGAILFWPFYPRRTIRILKQISLPIWAASLVVEGPVKKYFRRRRPFITIIQAVVVGKKPGNWSFPSGHSATAFAGAAMLGHCLPGWRPLWYLLAGLVGFSRIYLGAHYPGDVLSGSIFGIVLSEVARWLMKFLPWRSRGSR